MKISGNIFLKGDKSLAHRAIMLASISKGESRIKNIPNSEDVMSTVNLIRECGINIKGAARRYRYQKTKRPRLKVTKKMI